MRLLSLPTLFASLSALATVTSALTYHGADISSLPIVEAKGIKYSDGGSTLPFERILANHGANLARIRVWTAGDSNLNTALALAKRAKAVGMKIMIDLHYSDTCEYFIHMLVFVTL
jgi:arabinogalactan endo-1,4-beta-galactosidase